MGVTLDELANGSPLVITREVVLPVDFVLAARAGIALDAVAHGRRAPAGRRAVPGLAARARCRRPPWSRCSPTARPPPAPPPASTTPAICAPIGAERHQLAVLAKDDRRPPGRDDPVRRWWPGPGPPPPPTGDDVTSLAVYISHDRVGALLAVLTELAVRGVNLTRIESRPTGERLGRYAFFLDCTGHVAEARMGEALQGLHRVCADVRFLGSYPRGGAMPRARAPRAPAGHLGRRLRRLGGLAGPGPGR